MARSSNSVVPRFLAIDLEIAKQLPPNEQDLLRHRPLGICCAGTAIDGESPLIWHGRDAQGTPTTWMTPGEASQLVDYLLEAHNRGFTIVTWNGLHFDFNILAEESNRWAECRALAYAHVDMMFHVLCERGYPIGLDAAAKGFGLAGKPAGLDGSQMPGLWAQGYVKQVIDYQINDVLMTLQVAMRGTQNRQLTWRSKKGNPMDLPLPSGWLPVSAAAQLPEPDTSWMSSPIPRGKFLNWVFEQ